MYDMFDSACFLHCCPVERLLRDPSSSTIVYGDPTFNMKCNVIVIGVCNGLVCLMDITPEGEFQKVYVRFWNPATRLISGNFP